MNPSGKFDQGANSAVPAAALGKAQQHGPMNVALAEIDRLRAINAELLAALQRIAITDDADCKHANDPRAMIKIARAAIAKAKP